LVFDKTIALIDEFLGLEDRCRRQSDSILAVLENAIGSITIRPVRQELIQLRRDIFNDRNPKTRLTVDAEQELLRNVSSPDWESLQDWLQCRLGREELSTQAREVFGQEASSKNVLMAQMFRNREFRKGLALASPSLSEALERYLEVPQGAAVHRRRRIERGVLRYYTRAAFKLSPFSSFTRSRLIRLLEPRTQPASPPRGSRLLRRVTINRTLIGCIAQAISQHPDLANEVPVYSVRSLRRDGDTLMFVSHRYGNGGPNRLRVPKEALVRIKETRATSWILSYLEDRGGMAPLGDLRNTLTMLLGHETKASEFIAKLIDLGLLIHKVPLPQDDSPSLEALDNFLAVSASPFAQTVQKPLRRIIALVGEYAGAGPVQRCELIKTITATVTEIFKALSIQTTDKWDGLLLYEDCIESPTKEIPRPSGWESALQDLKEFFDLYTRMLDGNISIRETIRHALVNDFNRGPVPFLKFAERYNQLCSGDHSSGRMAEMSYTVNPLNLSTLNELAELRQEFGSLITQDSEAESIDLRAAAAVNLWPQRLADVCLTTPTENISCFSTFCQPMSSAGGDSVLVINKVQPGPCRPLLRFCSSLQDSSNRSVIVALVERWLTTLRERAVPCEVLARFDYNVNFAPFVTTKVINYVSAPEHKGDSLQLGNLYLSLSDTGEIVLTHRDAAGEEEIVPVVFGMMAPTFEPPLEFLLLSLGTSEPVLYRPFDPQAWGTEETSKPSLLRYPRLTFGNCIVRRRGWLIPRSELPLRAATETDFDYFVRVRRWQKQVGLPDEVFAGAQL